MLGGEFETEPMLEKRKLQMLYSAKHEEAGRIGSISRKNSSVIAKGGASEYLQSCPVRQGRQQVYKQQENAVISETFRGKSFVISTKTERKENAKFPHARKHVRFDLEERSVSKVFSCPARPVESSDSRADKARADNVDAYRACGTIRNGVNPFKTENPKARDALPLLAVETATSETANHRKGPLGFTTPQGESAQGGADRLQISNNEEQHPLACQKLMEPEPLKFPTFVMRLRKKEIEDDFVAINGRKPGRRPKKRTKVLQKAIEDASPGMWLPKLSMRRYEVIEEDTREL